MLYFLSRTLIAALCLIALGCSSGMKSANESNRSAAASNSNRQPVTATLESEGAAPVADLLQPVTFAPLQKPDGLYIIFDASGSMLGQLPDRSRKISVAKQVLQQFVAGNFEGYELAFRAYGHRRKEDCTDSQLLIPFGQPTQVVTQMKSAIQGINALGRTPITYSLQEALKDFGDRSGEIILISDGLESCDADPCALVREWKNRNVKIRVHVVGFGLEEKEKASLKCLAEAAGTDYHDANTASALADELAKIHQKAVSQMFVLRGMDKAGNRLRVRGILSRDGKERYRVTSESATRVEAGEYLLTAGVLTANGSLYKPVTQTVKAQEAGNTTVEVQVETPPRVRAKFAVDGEAHRGSLIRAYQNSKEVFSFRPIDEVYIEEGAYEFRAKPNADNDLSVMESFQAGDRKEIVFGLARTVIVTAKMLAKGSGIWFRENLELWQNGEKRYLVHMINGSRVLPGTYDLRLPNRLTPYVKKGLVVTDEAKQHFDITVPVGHVTFVYQKADGSRDKDDRCFASTEPGNLHIFRNSGQKYPLTPGRYNVEGWQQKGFYGRIVFEIKEGEEKEIVLRAKR
jgi:hypothetical protein